MTCSPRAAPRARVAPWLLLVASLLASLLAAAPAAASPKQASKHFTRGVALYGEADYRAALVEFKRAYDLAPNPAVLYNIGQTYFQLQSYAAALTTFERYLADAGPAASHRAEVEQSVETLRSRVGKLDLKTDVPGVEIVIDDEPAGTTPLGKPILVSIGRRKVVATLAGEPAQSRNVEIAADETVELSLTFAAGKSPAGPAGGAPRGSGTRRITVGLATTGVLAAGALTLGVLAFTASRELDDLRGTFPVSREQLDDQASRVKAFSLTADVLGVAALVAGGFTLYLVKSRSRARTQETRVGLSPSGLLLSGRF